MNSVTVTTQAELDAALEARADEIWIKSPAGIWLRTHGNGHSRLIATGSAHIVARDSAHVVAWDSVHVDAWDSVHVIARGSARVNARDSARVNACGSARVNACGSARVDAWVSAHVVASGSAYVVAWDSVHVNASGSARVDAWGSARVVASGSVHVNAWGSVHVNASGSVHVDASGSVHVNASGSARVVATPHVAIHRHSPNASIVGGHVINLTALNLTDPAVWCEHHGVTVDDGVATLYKALDSDLTAGNEYNPVRYEPGEQVTAIDWRDDNRCGGGLHFGPTPHHATNYQPNASRWVAVAVPVADLRPIVDGGVAKCKAASCVVLREVDRYGEVTP